MVRYYSFVLIFILILINSLEAANKYSIADNLLKNGDYDTAAKEYLSILQSKGSITQSRDIHALTGAFISLYMNQDYKKSFALCKRVLKLQSYNSAAIFYAGQNLGALGKIDVAKKLYKYYTVLPYSDPYRPFIKARLDYLIKTELDKKILKATQLEGRVNTQKFSDNSIAVIYFVNDSEDRSWDPLSKGLTDFLISDLSKIKNLNVVQQDELQILIDQLHFTQTDLLDENLVPRLGRLLNSKTVISGSFLINNDSQIMINMGILDLNKPDQIDYTEISGKLNNIIDLEKRMIDNFLEKLNIPVSKSERKKLNNYPTQNFDAFISYCHGLENYDSGNYNESINNFAEASKKDPSFVKAFDFQQTIDAMIMIEQGNIAMQHFEIMNKKWIMNVGRSAYQSNVRTRLEQISYNLSLGFLPGVEAYDGISGINRSIISFFDREILPEPPDPPGN